MLHYYTSKKIAKSDSYKKVERSLDETSLLAFGMMVESWVDDLIDESTAQMFLEHDMEYDVIEDEEGISLESLGSDSSSSSSGSSIDTDTDLD